MINRTAKTGRLFGFWSVLGIGLGLSIGFAIGHIIMGVVMGLCLSFLLGTVSERVYRRFMGFRIK